MSARHVGVITKSDIERPSHFRIKDIVTIFFNGTGEFISDLLLEGKKMNSMGFAQNIIDRLAELCGCDSRQTHQRKFTRYLASSQAWIILFMPRFGTVSLPPIRTSHAEFGKSIV
jgi:hypothetical protein